MEINAGEYFLGECSSGTANIIVGEKIPNKEKALVKVIQVDGPKFTLGPMRAGEIVVKIPCQGVPQEFKFTVKELPPEAAQNHYKPLGAESVPYPATLFLLILLLFAIPIFATLVYLFRKKKVLVAQSKFVKKKESARELLEKDFTYFEANVTHPEGHHFHQLYKRLRKFIEQELNLKTRSLTTGEFLGTFRALALQQSANQALIAQLEYVLKTADDVRFAGKSFTPELWKDYLQRTRIVIAAFPKPEVGGVSK